MKNLQEQIIKIKGLMKMIQEEEYTPSITPEQWELDSIMMHVMADWVEGGMELGDSDVNLSEGWFTFNDSEERYFITYSFDVEVTAHSWFKSGTYDDPPEGENTEYHFEQMKLKIEESVDGKYVVIYDGPDFTNFEGTLLTTKTITNRNGSTSSKKYYGSDFMYDMFDDEINELDSDRDPDW